MFENNRKKHLPSTRYHSNQRLFAFASSLSYSHNHGLSSLCKKFSPDQSSKSEKIYRQQKGNKQNIHNTRSSCPKQFLSHFRCSCYHLCSFTCEFSIPYNTIQNLHVSSIFTRQNCSNHLNNYIVERHLSYIKSKQIFLPRLTLFILLLLFLFPLTLATKSPSTTKFDRLLFTNYTGVLSLNFSLHKSQWHAGCCRLSNEAMCDSRSYSPLSGHSVYASNDTSSGTFLFDGGSHFIDRRQFLHSNEFLNAPDFLHNQTVFCLRYDVFRHLSLKPLAIFTYCIVVIGIIFNACVFLVLMCGSMRRSTSFTLFLALTCFDLLSLASSLFALLFRTVMTYLKTSALFCKMFGIFFLYFRQCSSTTLLLIAIERCIVIKYPFCRYIFDKFRLPFLAFVMLMFVVPIPFDFVFYTSGALHCEAFDTLHAHRYQIFRGFFTVFTYAMIPFVGIAISNLLIIIELKKAKKRFIIKENDGTMRSLATNSAEKRGTTVMLFVASFAFLLLLGPFYVHWCITYLFYNYPQCRFTRNLYENVQVCMGVFHPYLTVIEKGMRELNHATNFLLYMATSSRFRSDFKTICFRLFYRIFGPVILFFLKHVCSCCTEPTFLVALQQNVSDTMDLETSLDTRRKNQAAYKTSHYFTNIERRRRQNQLLQTAFTDDTNTTMLGPKLSPTVSLNASPRGTSKTVRTLTWNPYDRIVRTNKNERQAARISEHFATSSVI
ncbi:unnamed protein product [Rotaria socialis]|uniref:G-protein coupled receptors family 1 profile domain-containing protein n=1 Tax=Rotaria socialis TaxID=392032 RepID=A0A817S6L0_9BILA|nr:unnamed protein product [Rotaria socialis]CAF3276574.1 unnamed protein product [Rotaria socialis]CAF4281760.1 unnamed protein product [Rotaria socialis]